MAGKSLNKVMLIGNLGRDPETRTTPNGADKVTFSIAVSDGYKDKDGNWVDNTMWVNVVTFGKLAAICAEHLHKGSKVFIEGKLSMREYEDKATGTKKLWVEVAANEMMMLDSRSAGESASASRPAAAAAAAAASDYEEELDDIPF